jgi:hypothetical protein
MTTFGELKVGEEFTFIERFSPVLAVKITDLVWGIVAHKQDALILLDTFCVLVKPSKIGVYPTGRSFTFLDAQINHAKAIEDRPNQSKIPKRVQSAFSED